jgi:hypothetical protein
MLKFAFKDVYSLPTYFNETISWGKKRQKLNQKNRESII